MKRKFDSTLINFLKELKAFHSSSGNSVVSFPCISGRSVNLHKLYKVVSANGGYDKVSSEDKWPLILEELNIPEDCANASEVVKHIYHRYLVRFERSRKKDGTIVIADDGDDFGFGENTKYTPMARTRRGDVNGDFRSFLFSDVPQPVYERIPPLPPNFSRLYKSLLCGLPNEFDLGVSACLALSLNDNRIPLQPIHFSQFIDLLCAHAAVFGDDHLHFSNLYADWRKCDGLEFFKFWSYSTDCCTDNVISPKDLLFSPNITNYLEAETSEENINCKKNRFDNNLQENFLSSKEGFVVEMISNVFRNLSFDSYNAVIMSTNGSLLRFLLLGSCCRYRNVSNLCLDTIARLSPTITLSSLDFFIHHGTKYFTTFLRQLFDSLDRAQVLTGAEILASLCQNDSNFEDLCNFIDSSLCNKLFMYLLVPDIHIVVNCAEALYQLSELGPSPCDVIAANEHHLATLLALTTIEAVAFGPDAIVNIKVVAQSSGLPSAMSHSSMNHRPQFRPMVGNQRPVNYTPQFIPPNPAQLAFIYASNWLRSTFEQLSHSQAHMNSESLVDVYNQYVTTASSANNKAVFEHIQMFVECLTRVFPSASIKSSQPGRVETTRIFGIRRLHPIPSQQPATPAPPANVATPATMPLVPVLPNNFQKPVVNGQSESKRPVLPKNIQGDPCANQNDPNALHVVGNPLAAAGVIEKERRQHELAIVRVENKQILQKAPAPVNGVVTNGKSDETPVKSTSNGKTLDELLGHDEDNINGDYEEAPGSKKRKTEVSLQKVNGFVQADSNGIAHGCNGSSTKSDVPGQLVGSSNGHSNYDEASVMSSADSTSVAAFASGVDSESAAGDASRMSAISDSERRSQARPRSNTNSQRMGGSEHENSMPPVQNAAGPAISEGTNSSSQNLPQKTLQPPMPYPCHWGDCHEGFPSADRLHHHFVGSHLAKMSSEYGTRSPCLWTGCVCPVPRLKWSLLSHVKDFHLQSGSSKQAPPRFVHPDTETPADAGLRAIFTNFCQTTPFHPPMPGFEGPVTKQMRLVAGLIMRNLAKHSANGKRFIHRHINELVSIAFSGIESSSAVMSALDLADQKL